MRKSIVATTIALAMSSSALAYDIHSTDIEPYGAVSGERKEKGSLIKSLAKTSMASTQSTTQNSEPECTVDEFLALSPEASAQYARENRTSCVDFVFGSDRISEVFSDERVNAMIDLATNVAQSYDGTSRDSGMFSYLRGMYFQQFYGNLTVSDSINQRIVDLIDAWIEIPGFTTMFGDQHGNTMNQFVLLLDGIEDWSTYYPFIKSLLLSMDAEKRAFFEYQRIISSITTFLFRGQFTDTDDFAPNVLGQDRDIADLLLSLATDPSILNDAEWVANNVVNQIGHLLDLEDIVDTVIPAVQTIIDTNERLSQRWMLMVTSIDQYDNVSCDQFTGDVCVDDQLRAEIEELVFPNTFEVDGGRMVFRTSLSKEEVEQLTYQLQEVRANFFRVTGATEPVAGDVNDVAIFKIYGSRTEYDSFQGFLYNLPSNNGGIYIERDSTLYTWDREEWESRFTLEELARHEYVHYLNSRYLVPGYWGETEMYRNERQTWVDEGLANFFAGGTQFEGINALPSMVDWIDDRSTHYSPQQIVNLTYNDQLMYPYSALLFHYLYDTESTLIGDLVSVLRNDDVGGYDALRTTIGETSSDQFTNYVNNLADNIDDLDTPWKQYLTEAQLWYTDASDIEWELDTDFGDVVSNAVCDNESETQFACSFTISGQAGNLFELETMVNTTVEQLTASVNGNLVTANCYGSELGDTEHTVVCNGGLRSEATDFEQENVAPEAEDSSITVDEDSSVQGTMIGSDVNTDDVLEFVVTSEPSNGTLEYDETTGEFVYTPDSGYFGNDSFEFYVTDGDLESDSATVSITVNEVEDPNTAPTASNASYTVQEDATLSRTLSGSDADGDNLTYRIVTQPSSGSVTLNENTGAFTFTPSATGTVTFTYVVNDGEVDSATATITITVQQASTPTPAPTPVRETESSSGGGSMGLFSALGLLGIALLRRRSNIVE